MTSPKMLGFDTIALYDTCSWYSGTPVRKGLCCFWRKKLFILYWMRNLWGWLRQTFFSSKWKVILLKRFFNLQGSG